MGLIDIIAARKRKIIFVVLLVAVAAIPYTVFLITQHQKKTISHAATACTVSPILVNSCHPLLGAYAHGYPQVGPGLKAQVQYHEQRIGRQGDIVRGDYHVDDQTSFSSDEIYFINRPNTTLLIDWKVDKSSWAAASGGNATINARIDRMADTMKAVAPHKVMLVIYHEPENDVISDPNCPSVNFKGSAGTPTDYRNMWRNVVNRFKNKGVNNVVYVYDVEGYKPFNCLVNDLYPGNDLVDWVMFDIYSHGGQPTYQSAVGPFYQWLTSNSNAQHDYTSKPWGSGEYGIHGVNQPTAYAFYDALKQNLDNNTFPNIKAYIIFDSDAGSGGQPTANGEGRIEYASDGSLDPVEQDHYKAFANDPIFSSTTPPGCGACNTDTVAPTVSITAPAGGATLKGGATITATAADNVAVAKVVFSIDNTTIATDTAGPYSASLDTTKYTNASHTITATAYDTAGNTKTSQASISINNSTAPLDPAISAFTASPSTLSVGNATTLQWSSANTVNCSVSPDGPQKTTLTSWATIAYTSAGTKTYTLTCYNSVGKTASATLNVTVNQAPQPPAKPSLTADKTTVTPGSSVLFSWSSAGATSCVLNPGNVSSTGGTGSKLVANINQTTTYSLSCSNNAGSASSSLKVTVSKIVAETFPSIDTFTVQPASVSLDGIAVLSWSTSNVATNGCALAPSPLSSAAATGSWQTPPLTRSASFTLTCKDSAGSIVSRSLSVTVNGDPVPKAPDPQPTTDPGVSSQIIKALGGQQIVNAGAQGTVKQGELVTLDPSNILDEKKAKNIVRVEYYSGEKLIQTVNAPPYALNSKLLTPGNYTITERTYYIDGSQSQRTQDITVQNTAAVTHKSRTAAIVAVSALVIVLTAGFLVWRRILMRRRELAWSPSGDVDQRPGIMVTPQQSYQQAVPGQTETAPQKQDYPNNAAPEINPNNQNGPDNPAPPRQ